LVVFARPTNDFGQTGQDRRSGPRVFLRLLAHGVEDEPVVPDLIDELVEDLDSPLGRQRVLLELLEERPIFVWRLFAGRDTVRQAERNRTNDQERDERPSWGVHFRLRGKESCKTVARPRPRRGAYRESCSRVLRP